MIYVKNKFETEKREEFKIFELFPFSTALDGTM